jgi:hypothetical protein
LTIHATVGSPPIRKAAVACLKRIEFKKEIRLVVMRAGNFQVGIRDEQLHPVVLDRLI